MRALAVGGGPAGLYSACLLKQARPDAEVRVIDRNPPDATYGWGVVFSAQTLGALAQADRQSYDAILDNLVSWDAIDIHFKGERVRAYGHGFAGLSRKVLLRILQQRCAAVGVELTFEQEVRDFGLFADYDLVIAADGVNSAIRRSLADELRPTYDQRGAKFVWYGTTKRPEAFTYTVRPTEHGTFQATIYPYSDGLSTCIVECSGRTWAAAGLDRMTEQESKRFCEALFADVLDGHELLLNRSLWLSFTTVRNARWHHGHVVLAGDAAHTAHFSIGSGTKLAMEDAIDLVEGVRRFPALDDAIAFYERGRAPVVEAFQEAAQQSLEWFENLDRSLRLEPLQFMFNFLTRSGRISYDNVRERDSGFADRFDRAFAAQATGAGGLLLSPPPLFTPLAFGGARLPNRAAFIVANDLPTADGVPGAAHRVAVRHRAAAGAALVISDVIAVEARGRVTPLDAGLYTDEQESAWADVVADVHASGEARIMARLGHAGARGATAPRALGVDRPLSDRGWPLVAVTERPYSRRSPPPAALTEQEMEVVQQAFADAAERAARCRFDALELHAGHGYLLAGFLSPLTNTRDDAHGGGVAERLRFPLAVMDAVRARWPADRPLVVCLNADDCVRGGTSPEEAVIIARSFLAAGADFIHAVVGQTSPRSRPRYGNYFTARYGERLRAEAGARVLLRGRITSADEANTVVASGRADLCIMDVPGLAEHDAALAARHGRRAREAEGVGLHEAVA